MGEEGTGIAIAFRTRLQGPKKKRRKGAEVNKKMRSGRGMTGD